MSDEQHGEPAGKAHARGMRLRSALRLSVCIYVIYMSAIYSQRRRAKRGSRALALLPCRPFPYPNGSPVRVRAAYCIPAGAAIDRSALGAESEIARAERDSAGRPSRAQAACECCVPFLQSTVARERLISAARSAAYSLDSSCSVGTCAALADAAAAGAGARDAVQDRRGAYARVLRVGDVPAHATRIGPATAGSARFWLWAHGIDRRHRRQRPRTDQRVSAKARRSASISTCRYSAATQHATDPPATCRADHARRRVQLLACAGTALPAGCVPALRAAWGVPELCCAPRRPAHSMILSANSAVRPAADTPRCAINKGMPFIGA